MSVDITRNGYYELSKRQEVEPIRENAQTKCVLPEKYNQRNQRSTDHKGGGRITNEQTMLTARRQQHSD